MFKFISQIGKGEVIELIKSNLNAYCKHYKKDFSWKSFIHFFIHYPEFRVSIKIRLKIKDKGFIKIIRLIVDASCRHINLFVYTNENMIGKGLIFHHGFASMVSATSIGDNCHIFQQVTIGNSHGKTPIIGNNVTIYPGAKIFGDIKINDDVIIGANAVVTKDIPPHSIVAGIPAKIIKRRNSINSEWTNIID